ncbi:hypothetical protein [Kaarinaea lacus]
MKRMLFPLLIIGLSFSLPLYAGDALSSKTVRSFIDSLKDIEQLGRKYENDPAFKTDENQSFDQAMQQMQSPFSQMNTAIKNSKAYDEFVDAIKRNGFNSPEQWSQTGNRIYRAIAAVQMEKEMPKDMDQQMAQARQQMQSSGMSAEQQKMMMDMMAASRQMMQQFKDVPKADRETVTPFIAEFEQLGEE